ncbi:hypothetical protein PHLCEN_2v7229 [Hermanssonia centrifuga]|uniref:Uncharacterized protein n=1 Tax=Hermanssonia centrifuga TaxID=98765 RepID=A0A2R6NXA6_9APHY|nr:hypothetical protein PHLCEN_2v7229 [Hermanssonia centrifuga]
MAAFISHVTLDHLAVLNQPSDTDLSGRTPALKASLEAKSAGYDAICLPLTNDKWKARWRDMCLIPAGGTLDRVSLEHQAEDWRSAPGFMKDEVTITHLEEAEAVIAMVSDWLELDAADEWVRHDAEIALHQELAYASYLNIHTAILPPPRNRAHAASYARSINAALSLVPYMQLSVRLPIYDPSMIQIDATPPNSTSSTPSQPVALDDNHPSIATWEMWDVIRSICNYNPRLTLTLDLTPPLPSALEVLNQWIAEPTRYIFVPGSAFLANAKGYPVLPKGTQSFIRDIMKIQPSVILSGTDAGRHTKGGEAAYSQYIRHLEKTSPAVKAMQTSGTVENFAQGYQDYLQAPLQDRQNNEWGDKVQLLYGDMRTLPVPEPVDILVSELLGSFGDNELSPECLDGAMRFLKGKSDFISTRPAINHRISGRYLDTSIIYRVSCANLILEAIQRGPCQ